jgi:hypothetical protein
MNNLQFRLIHIFLLVTGLVASPAVLAQQISVSAANPASAVQGTLNLDVEISGNGFDETVDVVEFLLPCAVEPCIDNGNVIVKHFNVNSRKTIIANIDVLDIAVVADYDIAVHSTSRGRGGKGTTLFKVQSSKIETVSCMDAFFPDEDPATTNVICDCSFNPPGNDPRYLMLEDCKTSATLQLNTPISSLASPLPDGGLEMSTLTAVSGKDGSPFRGSSVFSNIGDHAGVRFLNIRFDPGVARGCGSSELRSAVSFILNEGTEDDLERASGLQVWDLTIDTYDGVINDPLCTVIELVREPGFTKPGTVGNGNKEGQVFVTNVVIADGSYERIGIRYEGMQPLGSINPPLVNGNFIGEQACGAESDTARAIQFGRVQLSDPADPSSQIAGVVQSNMIGMATGCGTAGGVGILVVGEPASLQMTAEVVKNDVSGAFWGVLVDDNVADINFSGNTLTGDGAPLSGDIGIDSDAKCTRYKGKPNKISQYSVDSADLGCTN